ncbi:MAG TPA: phosphatase PAP2 family protein [Polyangia bacterium]|jgi:membrane-associated phospholipid phosphatase|nr:phosphatase PAP2 family protein [Polyangia bacterium]
MKRRSCTALLLVAAFGIAHAGEPPGLVGEVVASAASVPSTSPQAAPLPSPSPSPPPTPAGRRLRYDLRIDVPITAVGGVAWIVTESLKGSLAPRRCLHCDRAPDGSDALNPLDAAVRRELLLSRTGPPSAVSHAFAFGVMPLVALGVDAILAQHDRRLREWPVDALVIAEAAVLAADVNQLVKFTVGRERPFVHVLPEDAKDMTRRPADNNLSFYSAHSTLVFSLAVASGTVATLRGYRLAPVLWASGLAVAATVGYLRIAADRHYFTDVLAGAAIGSVIGFVVPYLAHHPRWGWGHVRLGLAGGAPRGGVGLSLTGIF